MFPTFATCLLALVPLAFSPFTQAATHDVTVGGPGVLAYKPESINAAVGDVVVFHFQQKNHTATQSTLANPCVKADGGFDSGFVPVAANSTGPFPVAQFKVTDTKPVWVFCGQGTHCQSGMVFAINPGNNFAQFKNNAKSSTPGGTASSGAAPPTSGAATHQVTVGANGELAYDPPEVTANVGDTITFQFMAKNHTVTQSSFADPCRSLTFTSTTGKVGFDSGFMAVAAGATTLPTYSITVNDTSPIWVYCKQTGHCGKGMVFAVNAVDSGPNNYTAFKALAQQLNGTSGTSTGSAPGSTATSSGALRSGVGSGGFVLAVASAVAWLLC